MRPRNPCLCGHDEDIHCISMTVEKDRTITNEHRSNCEHEGCECKRFSPAPVPMSDTPEPPRRAKPRQVCYRYQCQNIRCNSIQLRGSSARRCDKCGKVSLRRLATVKCPIPSKLRIFQ